MSQVNDMDGMFYEASDFNQPIGDWDVGHVTIMYEMFLGASSFNQPLDIWDVSQARGSSNYYGGLERMFYDASR